MVPKPPIIQVAAGNGALMLVSPPDLFRKWGFCEWCHWMLDLRFICMGLKYLTRRCQWHLVWSGPAVPMVVKPPGHLVLTTISVAFLLSAKINIIKALMASNQYTFVQKWLLHWLCPFTPSILGSFWN
jgi:hypothetical protein